MASTAGYLSVVFLFLYVASRYAAYNPGKFPYNPADDLIDIVNEKRSDYGLSTLYVNQALSCIARQYIKSYEGDCEDVGGPDEKRPPEWALAETFAPNCGVIPSTLAPITGWFLGCRDSHSYVHVPQEFAEILITNPDTLDVIYSEDHTQVGAAATDGGSPYFWCVLLSNGTLGDTFVSERGVHKMTINLAGLADLVMYIGMLIAAVNLVLLGN